MTTGWIVIRNWDKHQHYGNRRVPWIKLYTELLYDDDFVSLTAAERAALVSLWMLYAETRQRVPEDTAKVSRMLGLRVTKRTLISLNRAGFIEVSSRQPSRPEVEVEKETRKPEKQLTARASVRRASESRPAAGAYRHYDPEPDGDIIDRERSLELVNDLVATLGLK